MRKWWLIGSGMLLASVMLAGGVIWYLRAQQEAPPAYDAGGSVQMELGGPASNTAPRLDLDEPDTAPRGTGNVLNGNASGPAKNGSNSQPDSIPISGATPAPEKPEDFSEYQKYKDSEGPLTADITAGTGAEAANGKTLVVDYRGWLTNGQIFDQSYGREQKFSFVLGQRQVIPGWDLSFGGMKVGGKRRIVVPPKYGYGDQAQGSIPPGSVLVFDVELLDVK